MDIDNTNFMYKSKKIILIGIIIGLSFWAIEPIIHVFIFGKPSLVQEFFLPDAHELWMRSLVVFLFILFGFFVQSIVNKKERLRLEIQNQSKFLNTVINFFPDPFIVIDAQNYEIKIANYAARRDSSEKFQTCYQLSHKNKEPCGDEEHICPIKVLKRTKEATIIEHIHYNKKGNPRNMEVHAYPLIDRKGDVKQIIKYSLDITKRKQMEKKLKRNFIELRRSNSDLEHFSSIVSHDIKSPLATVKLYVELLAQQNKDKQDLKTTKYINGAIEGIDNIYDMINGLLAYSRLSIENIDFNLVSCDEVLSKAITNLQAAIDESGAQISYGLLPNVVGLQPQLVQLFQNLIGNAIKYCKGQVPIINIMAEQSKSSDTEDKKDWIFSVRDNGIGIDPQYTEIIFDIFSRLHTKEDYSGIGVGLTICKKIVEIHGGRIWLNSEPEHGTTFYFTIPSYKELSKKQELS